MDGANNLMPPTAPMAVAQYSATVASPRPTIGFPLGTALLLIVIFCLSGIFSCCYHWDKLRCLRRAAADGSGGSGDPDDLQQQTTIAVIPMHGLHPSISIITTSPPSKISSKKQNHKQEKEQSLPVIMPGDQIPKYMAWPCPCQPTYNLPTTEKVLKEVVIQPSVLPNCDTHM